ncbi:MAG: DUF4230 domain-containing protein [Syntrophomonadaceae bacterium]|nr:DUF4230 domain-containing protein [Syntrophomonadaceae bacterium]
MGRVIGVVAIVILLLGGIAVFMEVTQQDPIMATNQSSEASLVQDRLVELSEWTTLRYDYRNVIVSRTERSLALPLVSDVNFSETIKLIDYTGYLKAGTDLSKVEILYNETSPQCKVRVPKARILDNVVETENAKVEDVKGSILSNYPSQIIINEINASKITLQEEKISQGFLEQADMRTKSLLISYLNSCGYADVVIEFY